MYFIQQLIILTPAAVLTGSKNIFLNRIRKKANYRYEFCFSRMQHCGYFSQCYESIRHLEGKKKKAGKCRQKKAVCNRKFVFRMYIYKIVRLAVCKT